MPKAVANIDDTDRFELKSCPEGFVVLRRMTYGQTVQRRALMKMSVQSGNSRKSFQGELAMASEEIQKFEFAHCIVEHNLEDVDGRVLNLAGDVDFAKLDPRIGQEIESLIGDMNNFDDNEDALGN
jgi:hypothetical protein